MKTIIVDDEKPARERIRRLLADYPNVDVVAEASNGEDALNKIQQQQPQLVFLDISMPVMNGVELARILSQDHPTLHIIFTTAYDQYALDAFDVSATDYLLKPIRKERLSKALSKIMTLHQDEPFITVRERDGVRKVLLKNIIYLHSDQKYVEIHIKGQTLLSSDSLKDLEQRYPNIFLRVHRSTLVNRLHFYGIEQDDGQCVALLRNCEIKPVISRRHQAEARQFLQTSGD
ncbi:LytR/AlgR family response regulator transcription factor [Kangiella sediminilitoris]|uniref:Two component transcriptional regulator, LytTR family n=1 Tax=Kangiella sediminilitoris TaxID=1144748 RepID=A0A1B3B7R2_9GAMM|nr:LytTR family DNA-binding domain-containing protein [Kangiella sediminilitoris]AOE48835.1 Two component transcriptional regulator, LytTR family [Kangiella sediminilitoris]